MFLSQRDVILEEDVDGLKFLEVLAMSEGVLISGWIERLKVNEEVSLEGKTYTKIRVL